MIKVSVVVPIYNVEQYLQECLEHIKAQTIQEIEVILVNDGSTDGSGRIAAEYVETDSRFKMISQNNQGLSMARNNGMDIALGKYVYFCDSDDYLAYEALETLYIEAEKEKLDILKMCKVIFSDDEPITKEMQEDEVVMGPDEGRCFGETKSGLEMMNQMLQKVVSPQSQLLFINREFLMKSGVRFYPGIIHEDNLFFFQVYWKAARVRWIPKRLYYLRKRSGSIMTPKQHKRSFHGYATSFIEMSKQCSREKQITEQYPNVMRYVHFCLAQALEHYKGMTAEERRECSELEKLVRKQIREEELPNKSVGMILFTYLPFLFRLMK